MLINQKEDWYLENMELHKLGYCNFKRKRFICFIFVRDILDILAQCNRPKPTPTCTSSLEFNRLYIHMLWFIVIQIIILHFYIIKM